MKIFLVIHDFWPKHRAGTENATYFLARELAKKHEVTVFTIEQETNRPGFQEVYRVDNFRVVKIHHKKNIPVNLKESSIDIVLDKIFEKYLNEIKPDIVHFQHLISLSLNFIKITKEKKKPIVYTVHDFWFRCPLIRAYYLKQNCDFSNRARCNKCIEDNIAFNNLDEKKYKDSYWVKKILELSKKRFRKRILYILLDNLKLRKFLYESSKIDWISIRERQLLQYFQDIDVFITPSNFLSCELEKFGIKKEKIKTIPHGIPIPEPYPVNEKRNKDKDTVNFYFISHITEDKGFFLLINNFLKLSKVFRNVKLKIYGAYSRNDQMITKAIAKLKYEKNIDYLGVFDNNNLGSILKETDVIVIPSLWREVYGLVLDEAFLYGIPVIISRRGALPERVKDGINGLVFDPDKKNDLYKKMEVIAKNPTILNDLKKNIPRVKSIKTYAKEIEGLYRLFIKQD